MSESMKTGLQQFKDNICGLKDSLVKSYLRAGKPTSDMSRTALMVNNFFLHIQGAKTHINTLRPTYTFGLGLIAFFLFVITCVSGALEMIFYNPSIEHAYSTVKDINYVVFAGRFLRNVHKWSGEGMIVFVLLHMARVLYTNSYKRGREFNWLVGIILLVLTFLLNLSGYMLPWDQLSYWAMVIVSNIMQSPKELTDVLGLTKYFNIGGMVKEFFLAGTIPGAATLNRVYFLHVMLLPVVITTFIGVHFWRIRKDGGLTVPDNFKPSEFSDTSNLVLPKKTGGIFTTNKTYGLMTLSKGGTPQVDKDVENMVLSWPNLAIAEAAVFILTLAAVIVYSLFVNSPLKEAANALIPENPAKAPWYFLGLQEMVSYSAFMGSIVIPSLSVLGLALIPYLDRDQRDVGIWFSGSEGKKVAIKSLIVGVVGLIAMLAFVVHYGWFRNWWPGISQLWIILINPAVLWLLFVSAWSIWIIKSTNSTRMGAIALFTMFIVSYLILTYVGTELRGPNWGFYWSKSQWPIH